MSKAAPAAPESGASRRAKKPSGEKQPAERADGSPDAPKRPRRRRYRGTETRTAIRSRQSRVNEHEKRPSRKGRSFYRSYKSAASKRRTLRGEAARGQKREHQKSSEQHRNLAQLIGSCIAVADVVQVGKDVLKRLQDENTQSQCDARKQERLSPRS